MILGIIIGAIATLAVVTVVVAGAVWFAFMMSGR